MEIAIGEKTRKYLILEPDKKITVEPSMSGILAVYGRFRFDSHSDNLESYQIQIFENGKPKDIFVDFVKKGKPNTAKSRIGQWEIGDKQKEISFQLIDGSGPIYLRLSHYVNYE